MVDCNIRNMNFHMELLALMMHFSIHISQSVNANFVIYRTCYVLLGYSEKNCSLLGTKFHNSTTNALEKLVQPSSSKILLSQNILTAIGISSIVLFIGPWSDIVGRKPAIIAAQAGYLISSVLMVLFSTFQNLSPWYFLFSVIPILSTGGLASNFACSVCYITDITDASNRGLRLGIYEGFVLFGIFLGNVTSSFIFDAIGYVRIFGLSSFFYGLGLLYVIFIVPESVQNPQKDHQIKSFFRTSNLKSMVKTTLKKRENYQTAIILICLLLLSIYATIINGEDAVFAMFLRSKFHWSLETYNLYKAVHNVTQVLMSTVGIWFLHKWLRIEESVLVLLGFIAMMSFSIIMSIARKDWEIFAGGVIKACNSFLSPMIRSIVSIIAPVQDAGKIFSAIVASEHVLGLIGAPSYTGLYNLTLNSCPQSYNFVTAALSLILIVLTIYMMYLKTKSSTPAGYQRLIIENNETEENQNTIS